MHRRLDGFLGEDGTLLDCAYCGGQFVSVEVLHAMLCRYENVGLGAPRRYRAGNPISEPIKYVRCPVCGDLMLRRNFGRVSGVVVDVCAKHGTWFDVGELARILEFVGDGGLQRAAALSSEAQEQRKPAGLDQSLTGRWPELQFADRSSPISWDEMRESALEFARWVRSQFR
jgi:Zn-finger nucleic acid-binding protein